jgi:hypothetical protein
MAVAESGWNAFHNLYHVVAGQNDCWSTYYQILARTNEQHQESQHLMK